MVIKKRQRRADRKRMQPQRQFRKLDRHRIEVDAVDHALQNDAADEVPVIKLFFRHRPVVFLSRAADLLAQPLNARGERGTIGLFGTRPGYEARHLGDRGQYLVREIIYQRHKEMAGAHCRIADPQSNEGLGWIVFYELAKPIGLRPAVARECLDPIGKGLLALSEEWPDGTAQDQTH